MGHGSRSLFGCWSGGEVMKPQIYYAVYDSSEDSDYYGFEFMYEAVATVNEWIVDGLDTDLMNNQGAEWGRLYVCSVDAELVPDDDQDPDCEWSLFDLEDSEIKYRDIFSEWGEHGMTNIGASFRVGSAPAASDSDRLAWIDSRVKTARELVTGQGWQASSEISWLLGTVEEFAELLRVHFAGVEE